VVDGRFEVVENELTTTEDLKIVIGADLIKVIFSFKTIFSPVVLHVTFN
jgi:hypothetical protein